MSFYECEKCGGIPGVTVCCTNERQAMTHTSTEQPVAYLWQHTITGQTKALMYGDVFTADPHWRLVGPLFLATKSGQVVVPEAIEQMAVDRYKVVPSHESMLHRWAVVAGEGTQQLYIGREGECQNMAQKFMGAFLDGAFVAMQNAAAPQIDWESAAEKIAIEVADNCGTVPNLTHPHIYLGLKKLFATAPVVSDKDHVLVPRGLIGAACYAIEKKRGGTKTLAELRRYTTGDLSAATQAAKKGNAQQ